MRRRRWAGAVVAASALAAMSAAVTATGATAPPARAAAAIASAAPAGSAPAASAPAASASASASASATPAPAASVSSPSDAPATAPPPEPSPPLGVHAHAHRTISTHSAAAQAAYDRGLLFLYAFNIGAARESFKHAAGLDPGCAMAQAGIALSTITDINVDPDPSDLAIGRAAVAKAASAAEATPDERALIAALTLRFATPKSDDMAKTAYASAMLAYASAHPADDDAGVETAFAIWQAEPDTQTVRGREIEALLDRVLANDPAQFGARHLRIHYEEGAKRPASALPDAIFLQHALYAPGESHLPHMAGHIFDRVGDFPDLIDSNQTAIANDAEYFAHDTGPGVDYMRYYHNHDLDFVLYGLTTIGENDAARDVAKRENDYARVHVALRLHDWTGVLRSGTTNPFELALANAGLGHGERANAILASDKKRPPSATLAALVRGEIDRAKGNVDAAVADYAVAYDARGSDLGDPKMHWATPVGEAYAAALLRAGKYAEAEKVLTDELTRYPNDPHLLFARAFARDGLHEASGAGSAASDRAAASAIWRGPKPPALDDLG